MEAESELIFMAVFVNPSLLYLDPNLATNDQKFLDHILRFLNAFDKCQQFQYQNHLDY